MGIEFKPKNTIYINGVPISGVKEINLEPAHPTGDADMYKKQAEELYTAWFKESCDLIDTLRAEYGTKLIKDDIAVAVAKKPEPKKVYLTTHNPYMSKDWKERFEKIVKERMDKNPYIQCFDTDVASMYPKLEPLVKEELATYSPSKQLYAVGKLAAKGFNKDMRKVHEDAFDAVRYSFDKYCDYAMEKSWEDYCYMIPPRAGKSAALGAIKLGERELEYCKQDVEETMRLYNTFKEKEESMNIVIYRSTSQRAREASRYLHDMFMASPYGQNIIMSNGGLCFNTRDNKLKIRIYYGGLDRMIGFRADYYSADTEEARLYLSQRVSKCDGKKIGGLYGIWDVAADYMEEHYGRKVKKEEDMGLENDLCLTNGKATIRVNGHEYYVCITEVDQRYGEPTELTAHIVEPASLCRRRKTHNLISWYTPEIDQVIFNAPATIVYWKDGTKTVVQARDEMFDPEKGLAMAISKKAMGNTRDYYIPFKKWLKKFEKNKK